MKHALWLLLLVGCEGPILSLAERVDAGTDARVSSTPDTSTPDSDAEVDEDFIACSSAAECPNPRDLDEVLCNLARGECVECLSDQDCPSGESCDADGDCDD